MKKEIITQSDPKSPISEVFRALRTNLQFMNRAVECQTILITSTVQSEGKSWVSANLATTFAQTGAKTLLIDADMRKPTVHYTFSMNNAYGLTNVLTRQTELKEAIKQSKEEKLDVLTSGPIPPNPAELLSSRAMDQFFQEAKEVYDIIIFDTPPVLAVTDAQVLANKCDGAVLVVSSGKTEIESAQKTKELLTNAQGKILGVVLNNKKIDNNDYYYYYGNE